MILLHEGELRADLQQFYNIDLDRAMGGEHTARHIAALAVNLPRESRLARAGDPDAVWGLPEILLAILINNFNLFVWGMSDKRKRGRKPDLVGPKYLTDKKRGRTLEARVMPIEQLMRELSKPRGQGGD